jgi:Dolichyl-phosphate-mannose-protein mannosyltransferase
MNSKRVGRREAAAEVEPRGGGEVEARTDAELVGLVLAVKFIVLLYGAQAYTVLRDQRLGSVHGWLAIWNQWDAPHYLDLARGGYVAEGVEARWIVFYPFYPWLVRAAAFVLRDHLVSAFFVSAVASVVAAMLLYRLARLDEPDSTARASVLFLLTFPTAYFLHIGYTESLFLALAVGAFLAAREGHWRWVGLLGGLAGMTRVNGLVLLPALACEAYAAYRAGGRRWRWEWLWVLSAGVGFGCYLLINYLVHGDPLAFMRAQDEFWYRQLAWPWTSVGKTWEALGGRSPSESLMVGWQELFFLLLGLAGTVWCWARQRTSYAVWMTLNWLLWTSTTFVLSVPRYTLVMFPLFLLFARTAERRPLAGGLILVWSLLFMGLFVARFVTGHWAF